MTLFLLTTCLYKIANASGLLSPKEERNRKGTLATPRYVENGRTGQREEERKREDVCVYVCVCARAGQR